MCFSLREAEGLTMNLASVSRVMDNIRKYLVMGLIVKFKRKSIEIDHLLPCVRTTSSVTNVEL